MKICIAIATGAALALTMGAASAHAEGIGVEADYARANQRWGTELGAGYEIGLAGFSLTPAAGAYLRDGDVAAYGRVEAAYQIPLSLKVGVGVRFSDQDPRPYATVSMPIFPKVAIKGNAGPKYVAVGLTLGY